MVVGICGARSAGWWLCAAMALTVVSCASAVSPPAPRVRGDIAPGPNNTRFWRSKHVVGSALAPYDVVPPRARTMAAWWENLPPVLQSLQVPRQVQATPPPGADYDAPYPAVPPPARQSWPSPAPFVTSGVRGHHRIYFKQKKNPQTGQVYKTAPELWAGYGGTFDNRPPSARVTGWADLISCYEKQFPTAGAAATVGRNDWAGAGFRVVSGIPVKPQRPVDQPAFNNLPAPFEPTSDTYSEYDVTVHPPAGRGQERIVRNDRTGELYFTEDHYCTFIPLT
ncbi:ribonuclease domain-containing protein [Streptomyces noursei]|uniref:ribonuclease domain-containing protein n=1 Tax=Streptomyces noursei TaxID=1971 RepID=UPI0035DAEB28